nr:hypothetical protein [Tanacetum cinerariifolium]
MGLNRIAKVAKGWFLGCDQSLDFRGGLPPESIYVWIYKIKLDEYGDVLKNKASPVNLICKHLVKLFHLELKMNDVWVERFNDFIYLAFKVSMTLAQLFSTSRIWDEGITQAGSGVAGLSSSRIGFNHSGLCLIFGRCAELVSSESDILAISGIESFFSSNVTRATNSDLVMLYGCGEGGRVVVVVFVVAVKIGAFMEDACLGGERLMIGVDSGGIKEEA